MSSQVNIKTYKEITKTLVPLKDQINVPIFLWGRHGIGKTQVNQQVAAELDYNYVVLNLANQTPEELLGYGDGKGGYLIPNWFIRQSFTAHTMMKLKDDAIDKIKTHLAVFKEREVVSFGRVKEHLETAAVQYDLAMSEVDKDDDEEVEKIAIKYVGDVKKIMRIFTRPTIYFLDEINRAPKYVLQAIFNFVNEGRIHTHYIGPKDVVIAAGNPDDVDYEVVSFDDAAFLSRFAHFHLEPDTQEYLMYLEGKKSHPALLNTIRTTPEMTSKNAKETYQVQCSPDNRSLEKIGILMQILPKEFINEYGPILFGALIGDSLTGILMENWKEYTTLTKPEEILSMPVGQKYKFRPTDLDVIIALNANIAKFIQDTKFNEKDSSFNMTKPELVNLNKYLKYIPKDSALQFVSEMKHRFNVLCINLFDQMDEKFIDEMLDVK